MAKFRAITMGIRGNRRIRPGDTFDAPSGFTSKWAEPVAEKADDPPAAKKKAAKKKVASK